jgi:predicted transcriptional regulator
MTNLISTGFQEWIKSFGINANTLLLVLAIGGAGFAYANQLNSGEVALSKESVRIDRLSDRVDANNASSLKRWDEHNSYHNEAKAINSAENGRTNERLNTLENAQRKLDELSYKQAATDTNVANLGTALKEVQNTVNNQSTVLSVQTEILKRIEQSLKEQRLSGTPLRN